MTREDKLKKGTYILLTILCVITVLIYSSTIIESISNKLEKYNQEIQNPDFNHKSHLEKN